MCTVILPPGDNPIGINKYIIPLQTTAHTHTHTHRNNPLVPTPHWFNPGHTTTSYSFQIHSNILFMPKSSKALSHILPPNLFFPMYGTALPSSFSLTVSSWLLEDRQHTTCSSSLCNCLQSPATTLVLSPNKFLSTELLKALSPYSSLNVTDQAAHPHTTGMVIVLYILTHCRWAGLLIKYPLVTGPFKRF